MPTRLFNPQDPNDTWTFQPVEVMVGRALGTRVVGMDDMAEPDERRGSSDAERIGEAVGDHVGDED